MIKNAPSELISSLERDFMRDWSLAVLTLTRLQLCMPEQMMNGNYSMLKPGKGIMKLFWMFDLDGSLMSFPAPSQPFLTSISMSRAKMKLSSANSSTP